MEAHKHTVLIIGGGTAGIMVAAQMKRQRPELDIGIIEPSDTHYYQPAWTLVGADTYRFEDTARPMKDLIPEGVHWTKEYAEKIDPEEQLVTTDEDTEIGYDYLVLAPGLVMAPEMVKGLTEVLDKGVVCSNYTDPVHTKKVLENFKGGTALFTQPTTPIKCGGAPQKIMYLADEYFRKHGLRDQSEVVFATPGSVIFGVEEIKKTLMDIIDRKDIHLRFGHELVEIDGERQIAWYKMNDHEGEYNHKDLQNEQRDDMIGIHYDMMHLAPPQKAPDFIAESPISSDDGWVSVDIHTLQHTEYDNIFALGDIADLPTAKTGAAIRKQAPIVVDNIFKLMDEGQITDQSYNGYSSCPLVTGYGKMVLAEFDYDMNFTPDPKLKQMLIFDSSKEHWRLWILKKYILPYMYWNRMMKGKAV